MTVQADNDNEEVLTLGTEQEAEPELTDRGDEFQAEPEAKGEPALDLDALKAVAKEDEEEEEHKADARIPKARFDEVNARMKKAEEERRALEEQLRALQSQQQPKAEQRQAPQEPAQVDLDAKEDEYLQALQRGDAAAAKAIRREINAAIREQAESAAVTKVSAELTKRETETSLLAVANESIKKYSFLNTESEDANQEAIADVVGWRDYYAAQGMRADLALQKAVDKIGPMYAPKRAKAEPEPEPKEDPRPKEAIKRNAEAANAQPALPNGVGERASKAKYDVSKMTEEEFDALPASEKKRLRGDA
jgi:hypothetical protein